MPSQLVFLLFIYISIFIYIFFIYYYIIEYRCYSNHKVVVE
jgi:hypothetical protein